MPTVLVVEDEGLIAADVCLTLRSMGFDVLEPVDTAEEAIRVAETARPSVVLMDIRLRGELDGTHAAHVIRARLGIPVVFLTSHADDATVARAMNARPYGYLLKPFRERELELAIAVALQQAESLLDVRAADALERPADAGGLAYRPTPVVSWRPRHGGTRVIELESGGPQATISLGPASGMVPIARPDPDADGGPSPSTAAAVPGRARAASRR
jgi:CheY-like chemotaxis protein